MVGQLLLSGSEAGMQCNKILAVYKIIKFDNFNSKACLGCLNGLVLIDSWPAFGGKLIVRLFIRYIFEKP